MKENIEWKKDSLGCLNIRSMDLVTNDDPRYMNLTRNEILFVLGKPNEVDYDSALFLYWVGHTLPCNELISLILEDEKFDYSSPASLQIFFNDSLKVESIQHYLH